MLLAEDVLLLAYDDTRGVDARGVSLDCALAAALLVELISHGAITIGPDPSPVIWVRSMRPIGDQVLDEWIANADRCHTVPVEKMVEDLGPPLRRRLLTSLAHRGVLRAQRGPFGRVRWPAVDRTHEQRLRRHLYHVLVHGLLPDQRTAALIHLLYVFSRIGTAVPHDYVATAEATAARVTVPEAFGRTIHIARHT